MSEPKEKFHHRPDLWFTAEQVEANRDRLCDVHLKILLAASTMSSYRELSVGLGLPMGTVKSRLNRARAAMLAAAAPS